MDLATGSAICNEAINFVTQRKEDLSQLQKIDERILKDLEMKEEETTTGVF